MALVFKSLAVLLLVTNVATATYIRQSDLPHDKWISLEKDVEYLPVLTRQQQAQQHKRRMDEEDSTTYYQDTFYNIQPFVDGEAEYDEYQQAWRYLGFMVDCNDASQNYDDDDGGTTGEGCHRYLLWAAYVDLDYEGGGIGEYQYWNQEKNAWDTTSCNYDENGANARCAKMDCHLEDTHFSLLGLFKHRSYDDWMEQLFKHEGFCVWSAEREKYVFVDNARENWPQGCTASDVTLNDGEYIYYDLKPTSGGGMDIGLYTDTRCMEEYSGKITPEDVLGNVLMDEGSGDGSGDWYTDDMSFIETSSLDESIQVWNSIFDTWKICHPCVAYDLNNVGYNGGAQGSTYNTYNYGYDDDGNNYDPSDFDCYDDADYTNVNQCMKFMAKTEMNTFTFRDISLASTQGTLVDYVPLAGYSNANTRGAAYTFMTLLLLIVSVSTLLTGIFMVVRARKYISELPEVEEALVAQNPDGEMT